MAKQLNIGLFGFGCVGQGLYHVLNNSTGFRANIKRICVKNKNKKRSISPEVITYDKWTILDDPDVNVVVELIDDAAEAYEIVKEAMKRGKHVVTANKKMLAHHIGEFIELQQKHNVSLLYEASSCGSIPIIRTLEEYFDNEELVKVSGIFNGTTNYLLTQTIRHGLSYEHALTKAQENGFAESDPSIDTEAYDPQYKLIIVALHAFGLLLHPDQVFRFGINTLQSADVAFAREKSLQIKLTPVIKHIGLSEYTAFCMPNLIAADNPLYKVENEFNGVIVEGAFSGEQFFQGRGAGSYPTGSAVLSDVSALSYQYKYEYKKYYQNHDLIARNDVVIRIYYRYNHEEEASLLNFTEIDAHYRSEGHHYLVGWLTLQNLLDNREELLKRKLFVALYEKD